MKRGQMIFKHADKIDDCAFNEVACYILPWMRANFNATVGRKHYRMLDNFLADRLQCFYVITDEKYIWENGDLFGWIERYNIFLQDVKSGKLIPYRLSAKLNPQLEERLEDFVDDFLGTVLFVIENLPQWRKEHLSRWKESGYKGQSHWIKSPCDLYKLEITRHFNNTRDRKRRHKKLPEGYIRQFDMSLF